MVSELVKYVWCRHKYQFWCLRIINHEMIFWSCAKIMIHDGNIFYSIGIGTCTNEYIYQPHLVLEALQFFIDT